MLHAESLVRSIGLALVLAWLGVALAPGTAHADDESEAKALFAQGRALRVAGDCAAAVPLFRRARTLFPAGLGSLRNEAECEESEHHVAAARRAWRSLESALASHAEPKYRGWADDASRAVARLAADVGTLIVQVDQIAPDEAARPAPTAVVTVNGEELDPASFGAPIEYDPATYVVRAAVGPEEDERHVALARGATEHLTLHIRVPAVPTVARAPAAAFSPAPARRSPGSATWRAIGWSAVGVGGASLAASGIAFLIRQSALDEFHAQCPSSGRCDSARSGTVTPIHDRGVIATTWANVLGAVGLVAVTTGGAVLLSDRVSQARAALVVTPGGAWLQGAL
jgi:hypothetical protein